MAIRSGQRGGKRRHYIDDWMVQGQADAGTATQSVMARMQREQAERERAADVSMWERDYSLQEQQAKQAGSAAQTATGLGVAKLGMNVGSKWGGWGDTDAAGAGSAGGSWGDWAGSAAGGAGIGWGLSNIFGSGSKKNQMWGTGLGALAGGLGSAFGWF